MSVDRGFTWMDDETIALIDIWGKSEIQLELSSAKRNFSVYEKIARELAEVGFSRTAYQCREKIKRLRKEYQIARYCVQHNVSQKKPMKYYEQVDRVLNRDVKTPNIKKRKNFPFYEPEDDMSFTFNPESDSNPVTNNDVPLHPVILSGPADTNDGCKMTGLVHEHSPLCHPNDSSDTLIADNEEDDDIFNKDCEIEDDSPWVPNVVLVENDEEDSHSFDAASIKTELNDSEEKLLESSATIEKGETTSQSIAGNERPSKRQKCNPKASWFQAIMDKVTEKFITYQESMDTRFLERVASLERERIKRDEAMQKLWMEFEDRRRKEEQQHELKLMSLFGQFVNQLLDVGNTKSKT